MEEIGPDWETADEVLDFAVLNGFPRSREQLRHWHKEGVVPQPKVRNRKGARGRETWYPAGTSGQYVEALRLKRTTKLLWRIKWQLWFKGYPIELEWIRELIASLCGQFDVAVSMMFTEDGNLSETMRQYMDDAADRPFDLSAIRHVRRRVSSQRFPAFLEAALLAVSGRLDQSDENRWQLYAHGTGRDTAQQSSFLGGEPLVAESVDEDAEALGRYFDGGSLEAAFRAVSDDDVENARNIARAAIALVSQLAPDVEELAGRWAGGLATHPAYAADLRKSIEVQMQMVALYAVNLNDPSFRETGRILEANPGRPLDDQHHRWRVLNLLARDVPDFKLALDPKRYARGIRDPDLMETINGEIRAIYRDHVAEVGDFVRRYREETGIELLISVPDDD